MPRLLDLFSGAGGAAMGYHRAGFDDIVGVDIVPQPNYPFTFIQADALTFLDAMIDGEEDIAYDLIHTSPPCQAYSVATRSHDDHPRLVEETRAALELINQPWVIENVPPAPVRSDVLLCGSMFGLEVQRHRIFELAGWFVWGAPLCRHEWLDRPWTLTGHSGSSPHSRKPGPLSQWQELMGMPWAKTTREIAEAVPPAYTEYLGRQFLAQQAAA